MRVLEVNFVGVVNGVYAGIPLLKRTPNSLCFSTSSSAALFGMPRSGMYAATKFAVKGLTEALSVELARFGSRAADVMPALIDTPILDVDPGLLGRRAAWRHHEEERDARGTDAPRPARGGRRAGLGGLRLRSGALVHPGRDGGRRNARAGGVEPLRDQFKKTVL